ncbi:hypothetical protein SAMN05216327_118113 [Dyadobacter sp. SG02]|nr:hypothetical protein SAMN05216327_118113 [Dyadobacter sp. SG02]
MQLVIWDISSDPNHAKSMDNQKFNFPSENFKIGNLCNYTKKEF